MPLQQEITYTTTGTQASLNLDPSITPFCATAGVSLASTGSYGLQFSLAKPDVSDANAIWFNSGDLPAGTTGSGYASFAFPVSRIRLTIASNATGITLQVLQGFSTN